METNTNASRGDGSKGGMKSSCAAQTPILKLLVMSRRSLLDSVQLSIRPYPCPNARAVWQTCLLTFLREVWYVRLVVEFGAQMLVKYQSAGPATRLPGLWGVKDSDFTMFWGCAERKHRFWEMVEWEKFRDFAKCSSLSWQSKCYSQRW